MKSTILYRPSVIIPLLVLAATLAFPQSRNYLLLQIGISQTKRGSISSLAFGTDKNLLIKPARTHWEEQNQLIATTQFEIKENNSDVYIKQHPEQTWLLTERIRALLSRCSLPERGELQFFRQEASPAPMTGPREDELRATAATKVLLPRIVHLCHLAKQQEPENAYYDLILAVVAYAEFRDIEGWRHLQEASRKTVFDPHYQDLLQMQLLIDRKMAGRPLIREEIFDAESVVLLRDLSFFRNLAHWLQWWAIQEIRDGNIQKAMEIQEAMSRIGSLMVRQARLEYVAWVGSTFMTSASLAPWEAVQKPEYLPGPPSKSITVEQQYHYVEEFARQHHLPALSQMLTTDLQHRYYQLRAIDRADKARPSIYEMAVPTISWNWCVWMLAFMTGIIAAQALLLTLKKQHLPISDTLRFTSAVASVMAILLPLVIFYYLWLGSEAQLHRNLGPDMFYANAYSGEVWFAVLIRALAFCFPLLIVFMACGIAVYLFHWRKLKAARNEYPTKRKLKVLLCDAAVLLFPLWIPALIVLFWALLIDSLSQAAGILYRAFLFYLVGSKNSYQQQPDIFYSDSPFIAWFFALFMAPMAGGVLYLLWRYIRGQREDVQKQYWKTVYSAMRFSLSGALLTFVILYGVSMTTTVISRQRTTQRITPFYQKGEMRVFGHKRDLTTPITAEQFFKYEKKRRSRASNRIDW